MPIRHGNTYRALGWLAVASLCTALYIGEALGQVENDIPGESPESPPQTTTQQENPPAPLVTPPEPAEPVASPKVYEPDCDDPDSREEADLCAQRRMANAAEDTVEWVRQSVEWAGRQYYATIGEIVALVTTVGVALVAVFVAARANRLSAKTLQLTHDNAKTQLRPWLFCKHVLMKKLTYGQNITGFNVSIEWINSGLTPALKCRSVVYYRMVPQGFDTATLTYEGEAPLEGKGANLGHEGTMSGPKIVLSLDEMIDILAQKKSLFFWERVEYKGIFDASLTWHTEVCFEIRIAGTEHELRDLEVPGFTYEPSIFGPHNSVS